MLGNQKGSGLLGRLITIFFIIFLISTLQRHFEKKEMETKHRENELINELKHGINITSVAKELGKMRSKNAVDPLISLLNKELKNRETGCAVVRALGSIGDVRAVEPLLALLKDKDCDFRDCAAGALIKFGWKPQTDIEKILYFIGKKKWKECVKFGELAVEPLIDSLPSWREDKDAEEKHYYNVYKSGRVQALSRIGKLAVDPLIIALKEKNCNKRTGVIAALALIGDARAVEPLIALLEDKDEDIRSAAIEALGKMKSAKAVGAIIAKLKGDDDYRIRGEAAKALALIGDVRAIDALFTALGDRHWFTREEAAKALEILGWIPKSDEEKVRYLIARKKWDKCVKFGEKAVGYLIVMLKDESESVRKNAARVLFEIGKPAVNSLIATLKDTYHFGRKEAAEVLGSIGDARAVEPLIDVLNDNDKNVRTEAAKALRLIGDAKAIPALVRVLTDWYAGKESAEALDKFGWKPKSLEEEIHYLVAKRKNNILKERWDDVKNVLLKDIEYGEYKAVENALFAFISIGKNEIVPYLIKILKEKGNVGMAEAYLNCGHEELRKAAYDWAEKHGYTVIYGGGEAPVGWGVPR